MKRALILIAALAALPAQELKDRLQLGDEFPLRYHVVEAPLITISTSVIGLLVISMLLATFGTS